MRVRLRPFGASAGQPSLVRKLDELLAAEAGLEEARAKRERRPEVESQDMVRLRPSGLRRTAFACRWLADMPGCKPGLAEAHAKRQGCKPGLAEAHAKRERRLAEREGFEPPCRLLGKTLSRRPRYDHFGTSPLLTSLGGAPLDSPPRCAAAGAADSATQFLSASSQHSRLSSPCSLLTLARCAAQPTGFASPERTPGSRPGIPLRARRRLR